MQNNIDVDCFSSFSLSDSEDRDFRNGSWDEIVDEERGVSESIDPWRYHSMVETRALPFLGKYKTYPGLYTMYPNALILTNSSYSPNLPNSSYSS